MQSEDEPFVPLVEGGAELAGAAAGAALGLLGGHIAVIGGAAGGAALTRALKRVGNEMALRMFGPRQQVRVGAA
jgi:hypothetical protein